MALEELVVPNDLHRRAYGNGDEGEGSCCVGHGEACRPSAAAHPPRMSMQDVRHGSLPSRRNFGLKLMAWHGDGRARVRLP